MDLKKSTQIGLIAIAALMAAPVTAMAAPHLTLTPSSTTVSNGQTFEVMLGVDSDVEKVIGIDVVGTFDASKLDVLSIEKAATVPADGYNFSYTPDKAIIHNDTGKFELTLPSADSSVYNGVVAKHDLLKVTFRAKAEGTAVVNLSCLAGSVTDSNIVNEKGSDVIDCASNQSGSYTILAGVGGPTDVPVEYATPTTGATELPQTGGVGPTVGLAIFGVVSVMAAWFLKFI